MIDSHKVYIRWLYIIKGMQKSTQLIRNDYIDYESLKRLIDNTNTLFSIDVDSSRGVLISMGDKKEMSALDKLTENITKKTSKELKYNDSVELTAEQKAQLALADVVIKQYGPKVAQMRDFFKSDQWASIVKKIGADKNTVDYLLRNTATALGESARAVEKIKEIIRRYGK